MPSSNSRCLSKKSSNKKSADRDLGYARDNVFAKLALLEFISGVGTADSKLAVYLTRPLKEQENPAYQESCCVSGRGPRSQVLYVAILQQAVMSRDRFCRVARVSPFS
jgi:hypothetical protein